MDDTIRSGCGYLLTCQDAGGGWGYRRGGMPFVEPTALAVVALLKAVGPASMGASTAIECAVTWLLRLQHVDGGWGVCAVDEESTWATSYAVWALALGVDDLGGSSAAKVAVERGLGWLLRDLGPCVATDSQALPDKEPALSLSKEPALSLSKGADPALVGWPWSEGECFWVFPTALAILAAVAAARGRSPRVRQGVAYLVDRACQGGGWNFGNPYMLDKALWPAEVETAAALLALKAAGYVGSVVDEGLGRLRQLVDEASSALNLAWGLLALQTFGQRHEAGLARLVQQQAADGSWRDNPFTTAVAVLAISEGLKPPLP